MDVDWGAEGGLDARWTLDNGYWILDARCWILDTGYWIKKNFNMSYKKLEIWQLAREISIEIHEISIKDLPKFEMFETGSQIRRSSKSVKSTIVEGYGRRIYKQEFIKFLIYSIASNDETIDHLETLYETKSFTDEKRYQLLHDKLELLGKKLNNFIQSVQKEHNLSATS